MVILAKWMVEGAGAPGWSDPAHGQVVHELS